MKRVLKKGKDLRYKKLSHSYKSAYNSLDKKFRSEKIQSLLKKELKKVFSKICLIKFSKCTVQIAHNYHILIDITYINTRKRYENCHDICISLSGRNLYKKDHTLFVTVTDLIDGGVIQHNTICKSLRKCIYSIIN